MSVVVLDVSAAAAGHLATAIRVHREWAARARVVVPQEVVELETVLTKTARSRQEPSVVDELAELRDCPVVHPLLVSYREAAKVLDLGVRTVERLVAEGEVPSVQVGGSVRIRSADLHEFVAQLSSRDRSSA